MIETLDYKEVPFAKAKDIKDEVVFRFIPGNESAYLTTCLR
jgi:hypothetical protein